MARWIEDLKQKRVVEGTLEEMLREFWCIEGNVRDYGLDVWLHDSGRLPGDVFADQASGNDLVAYAVAHRPRDRGAERHPAREWDRTLEGLELTPEEDVRLVEIMREWIRTRN